MTAINEPSPELGEKILNDILIHELECDSSLYGTKCDCIQRNVAKNIMIALKPAIELERLKSQKEEAKFIKSRYPVTSDEITIEWWIDQRIDDLDTRIQAIERSSRE